jgi:hypothetical protein
MLGVKNEVRHFLLLCIDEVTTVAQLLPNTADRVFIPTPPSSNPDTVASICDIQFFLPPTPQQRQDGETCGDNVSISTIDGAFFRAVQRQLPLKAFSSILYQISPGFLDYTITISRDLNTPQPVLNLPATQHQPNIACNVIFKCTIVDAINILHPTVAPQLIESIRQLQA